MLCGKFMSQATIKRAVPDASLGEGGEKKEKKKHTHTHTLHGFLYT
jgi:hypothetical protein